MSTAIPAIASSPAAPLASARPLRADVVIETKITVPGWVNTLDEYRRWAESDDYPQHGWVSYLNGVIFLDPSTEELLSHSRVKQAFNGVYHSVLAKHPIGSYVPDRMLLVNVAASLSTEPDGIFYLWTTVQEKRLQFVPGAKAGYMQLEGTPDTVLEIVSDGSVTKDRAIARLVLEGRDP